jgi:hypothetical protein
MQKKAFLGVKMQILTSFSRLFELPSVASLPQKLGGSFL